MSNAGRGGAFTAAVRRVLDTIALQPDRYPEVFQDVREALVTGYPYAISYRADSTQVTVYAVYHTSRDPAVWQGRV
ncbi:MAG: type II toxin-antitoxin system RelE/ParE family toxin [Gemmataceae bacterium]